MTELDVTMTKTCTEQDQAAVYSALLGACLANAPHCDSFMTWGFTDAYTWLPGRSPLMFDEQYQPKPAYFALQKLLASPPPPPLPFCIEHNCQGTVEVTTPPFRSLGAHSPAGPAMGATSLATVARPAKPRNGVLVCAALVN